MALIGKPDKGVFVMEHNPAGMALAHMTGHTGHWEETDLTDMFSSDEGVIEFGWQLLGSPTFYVVRT